MSDTGTSDARTAERGRRATRPSGDERQESILRTAEELLATRGFDDISIEDLATGAGLSRPAFYFYYSSKDAVLLALLDRVIRQVERRVGELPRDFDTDPAGAWRASIGAFVDVFADHQAVTAAAISAGHRSPEIRDLWSRSIDSWIDFSAEVIRAERARGAAPAGASTDGARDLAVALNLMNERTLSATFAGETPALQRDTALDVLASIWIRAIYATDLPTTDTPAADLASQK